MTTPTEREALLLKEMRYIAGISLGQVHRVAHQAIEKCKDMLAADAQWEALRDPTVLHVNLLRGLPARLTKAQLLHLLGTDAPDDAQQVAVPLSDDEINAIWSEPLDTSRLSPFGMSRIRAILAAAAPQPPQAAQACNCRFVDGVNTQQCTLHNAWAETLHEQAGYRRERDALLAEKAQQAAVPQEPYGYCNPEYVADVNVTSHGITRTKRDGWAALYLAPQPPQDARKPMTDAEITSLAYDCNALPEVVTDVTLIDFVRAIEAAHGIKEQP